MCGKEMRTISAPASFSQAIPCSHRASISAGMPSSRYSSGMPTRRPLTDLPMKLEKSGIATSSDVESLTSCEHMDCSMIAESATVLVIGPAWSSEEANATMP